MCELNKLIIVTKRVVYVNLPELLLLTLTWYKQVYCTIFWILQTWIRVREFSLNSRFSWPLHISDYVHQ